jgi:predicted negative regulator of RcsB-dependent stress response
MADRLGDVDMLQNQTAEAVKHYQQAWKGFEPNAEYRRLVAVKLAALGADPEDAAQEPKK